MPSRRAAAALVMASLLAGACSSGEDRSSTAAASRPAAVRNDAPEPPVCPLSGRRPGDVSIDRPAAAVKVENNPVAYPLSGLDKAEMVYEELVEGGLTRFMALFHCTDSARVGPVRSARIVDPAIMSPITRILADAGGNAIVRRALRKARIVSVDEQAAGGAMRRIDRGSVSFEHTLYGDTAKLRKVGRKRYDKAPPAGLFRFGKLSAKGRKVRSVTVHFSGAVTVTYRWSKQGWRRFEDGEPFVVASGDQITVDNVVIEQHKVDLSKHIVDVAGNPSIEIADVTGSGPAVLLRDGRAISGRWKRRSKEGRVVFKDKRGKELVLHPGVTWVELLPGAGGEVKGSFSFKKR
jgi:Protein of unknown function (DUF3048) N-terminal domain/Protein of unknown function (DUF3048) C-terminal domain